MTDALEDHHGTVSIGGRPITNLRFADDIDGLAGNECELASLVERLDKTSSNFGMEISAEKTKIMTNSKESSKKEIKVNGQILESIRKFKYLGSIISDERSKPDILSRRTLLSALRLDCYVPWSCQFFSMPGTVNGGRGRGKQKNRWDDNIREWTGLELRNTLRKAEDREEWKAVVRRSSAAPRRIPDLRDK
ncbi:endonuclease-reverse transcriptase [Plakobranchus ocellatus]|uniref:Endonuclease-reverse transcriptase n=1 Tax=Plakobranchus ocellatus TaxID=259542 RepID=A0AAV4B889_9GAST|nr:endonuclease-reverse transcriptase [Plakobranchus ocellatus]